MKELYLVTGALGHLGNTIIRRLLDQRKSVRGLALPNDTSAALKGLPVPLFRGDLLDPPSLDAFFKSGGHCILKVIHTAGIVSIASHYDQRIYDVNVTGTMNLIDKCREFDVERLVYTSSVHAIPALEGQRVMTEAFCPDPSAVYGAYAQTKAQATLRVLESAEHGLDAVVVYPSGIIGPNDFGHGHLTQLVRDYLAGRLTACIRGGYDFVDVRDVADGVISAADNGRKGEGYILSGSFCEIPRLLQMLSDLSGKKPVKTVLPAWFAKWTAPLAETYYKLRRQPPLYTGYSLLVLTSNGNFSCQKAVKELGYHPRPLEDTLRDTVSWLQRASS